MIENYIVTFIIDIAALLFLVNLVRGNNILNGLRKKPFVTGILLTVLVIIAEAGTLSYGQGSANYRPLHVLFNVIGFGLTPWIPIFLIAIFDWKLVKSHLLLLLPTLVNMAITILSPIYGLIFFVDQNNQYFRGPVFFVFVVVYLFNIFLLVIGTLSSGQKYLHTIRKKILILSIFTVAGTCIQLLFPMIYSSWHCVTLALFLYYILLAEFDGRFDTLTGLFNRGAFDKDSNRLKRSDAYTVVVFDIDLFKEINDTYGHDYGDLVLKTIASMICEAFNENGSCYRIGGDEFCVIIKETRSEDLEGRLKQLTDKLQWERLNDKHLPTVSYGYSTHLGNQVLDFQENMKEADMQMYHFKQLQKNKIKKEEDPS